MSEQRAAGLGMRPGPYRAQEHHMDWEVVAADGQLVAVVPGRGVREATMAHLLADAWQLPALRTQREALLAAAEAVIRDATDTEEMDGMPLVSWLVLGQLQDAIARAHGLTLPPRPVDEAQARGEATIDG